MNVWNSVVVAVLYPYCAIVAISTCFVIVRGSVPVRRVRLMALLRWGDFDVLGHLLAALIALVRMAVFPLLPSNGAFAALLPAPLVSRPESKTLIREVRRLGHAFRNLLRLTPIVALATCLSMLAVSLPAVVICAILPSVSLAELAGTVSVCASLGALLGCLLCLYVISHLQSPNDQMLRIRGAARMRKPVRVGFLGRAIVNLFYFRVLDILMPEALVLALLIAPATSDLFSASPTPAHSSVHDSLWIVFSIFGLALFSAFLGRRTVVRRMATYRALESILQYTAFVADNGRGTFGFFGPTPDASGHLRAKLERLAMRLDRAAGMYAPTIMGRTAPHPVSIVIRAAARELRRYLNSSNSLTGVGRQELIDHLDTLTICLTGSKEPGDIIALANDLAAFGPQGEPDPDLLAPASGRFARVGQRIASTLDSIERPARVTKVIATALAVLVAVWLYFRHQDLPALITRLK